MAKQQKERSKEEAQLGVVVPLDEQREPLDKLKPLMTLVGEDMARVNSIILDKARSDVELIPELARYLIDSGGKRMRPMLTIAAAKLSGYGGEGHVKLAASVEFMHTATLLHDDVVDESSLRRGKLAARLLWGNEASVLVGDFLLGQAFKMMVEVGSMGALRVLSNAAVVIAEGEVMQLSVSKNTATTEDEYMAVINAKTAALFSAAAEVGAIIAERSGEEQAALRSYGKNLGLAFQLIDDALDYSGEQAKLGKSVGDDFREGKITLPVVLSFRRGSEDERAFWRRTLQDAEIGEGDLEKAVAHVRKSGAIDDTIKRARHYGAMASDALAIFPDSREKSALLDAVEFCISRLH
jgi:octaprenyl-diphosphate synthase